MDISYELSANEQPANELPGTSSTVSPFQILPVSSIRKKSSNRGRRSGACVVTGSPYKKSLSKYPSLWKYLKIKKEKNAVDCLPKKKGKLQKRTMIKKQRKRDSEEIENENLAQNDYDSDVDLPIGKKRPESDDDTTCIFCDRKFSDDRKGKLRVQCLMCSLWAHVDCAGAEKDYYICDYCR
ncbi:uncharacterized protein LOC112589731 [Harpegnathos saltator]|uniref:uncharacterized protein LOC112589731 n=1 Tax=Harpegnathos saltator TaxID=610380 RepID=UPI000DBED69E|nr:uncharacterized protein LOC112589731 [Harpegnathos saltator]